MGMILEYDQSPNATVDQKVSTLKDSVQRALEDVEQNAEGRPGAPGVGIEEIIEQWLLSTSKISPIGTWVYVEERPEWKPNHYFWTRNEVHYTDGNIRYTTPGLADALNRAYEAAYEAGDILGDIETTVSTIEQTVEEITQLANESKELAQQAQSAAESANEQVDQVSGEIATANQQIATLVQELETLESTMEASYATKGELTEISTSLGTQIQQNAAQISSTASAVQQVDIDASQALQDAADAAAAAAQAQQNATDAQNKYTQLKQQADVTDEQLAAAKEAVEEAQKAATEAGDAAAAAQSAANSLADRVTAAESNITQMATQISATVQKVESMKIGGRNILLNSSFKSDYDEWTLSPADSHMITSKDGIDCGHVTGALNTHKTIRQPILGKMEPDTEYTVSGWVYTENIVQGTTNYTSSLYMDGYYNNNGTSTWFSIGSIQIPVNTGKWTYISYTFTSPNETKIKNATIMRFYVYTRDYTGDLYYHSLKLEVGNKATDWTPAPEDMASADDVDHILNEDLVDIRESITNLDILAEGIRADVSTIETKQNDMDDLKSQIEQITSVLIENGKVTFDFETIKQLVNDATEEIERRNRYVHITEDATLGATITIGDSESGMVGRFTKESLDFLNGDTVIASYANDGLTTENITTNNQLKFGSNWAIRPGAGGNLNDVWVGG